MTGCSKTGNKDIFHYKIRFKVKVKTGWIIFFVVSLFVFQNCKKEPDKVGAGIIPNSQKLGLGYSDTITIRAYSVLSDSVRTDETSNNLLGSYMDPVFGVSNSSFYTQVRLSSVNPDFGPNPVLDSLILTLDYNGYYGDTNAPLTVHVYELSERIYRDSVYYSNQILPNEGFDYANQTFYPRPNTPVYPESDTVAEAARLYVNLGNISPALGNKILFADSASLADNDNFLDYFKGLYVKVDEVASSGVMVYFSLESSVSKMTLYYHNDTVDSLNLVLTINENCAHFSNFSHNNYIDADPLFREQVINNDTTLGNDILYLQSMTGVETKIFFPYIQNWYTTEKILINEAKLVIPYSDLANNSQKPNKLVLYKYLNDGNLSFTDDEYEGEAYFGGYIDTVNHNYYFRVTRHIQHLMMGNEADYGLELNISAIYNNAFRMIFYGTEGENLAEKMHLELRYTIIE